jgi:hypothetical protein
MIALTKKKKENIESKVKDLENDKLKYKDNEMLLYFTIGQISILNEILNNSIVLPTEDNWNSAIDNYNSNKSHPLGFIVNVSDSYEDIN